jgi:hypothetical protein
LIVCSDDSSDEGKKKAGPSKDNRQQGKAPFEQNSSEDDD